MNDKTHGMSGKKNARVNTTNMTSAIHIRCTPEEKSYWIKWLRDNDKGKMSDYIRTLMPPVPDENP